MPNLAKQIVQDRKRKQRKNRHGKPELSREERHALHSLRQDAAKKGMKLASAGRGGLPPSLVYKVMKRDGFRCKIHGDLGEGDFGGITVHHVGGILESDWLAKKGHKNIPSDLVTVCSKGHDAIHQKARAEGLDSSQVLSPADVGTKHDHGQPVYKPGQARKQLKAQQ